MSITNKSSETKVIKSYKATGRGTIATYDKALNS